MTSTFFLGACTPQGFVSHYDSLFEELEQLYIIKGGSGCGKSTFMRRIGAEAEQRGLDVSYILCSSDPDSLDGVLLPSLSTGFVDGTAPHVLEPRLCGGGANYLNFGEFYDSDRLRANEAEIRRTQRENAAQYPLVTSCLAAADRLLDSVRTVTAGPVYDVREGLYPARRLSSRTQTSKAAPAACRRFRPYLHRVLFPAAAAGRTGASSDSLRRRGIPLRQRGAPLRGRRFLPS